MGVDTLFEYNEDGDPVTTDVGGVTVHTSRAGVSDLGYVIPPMGSNCGGAVQHDSV